MPRTIRSLALAVTIVALVSACAPEIITPPAVTVTAVPTEDRTVVPSPPADPMPSTVWPLTGLSTEDAPEADVARIAIAVKIDNSTEAQPQAGLDFADIVFEEYMARGGWTRFVAVFQTTYPDVVGDTRSQRPMDPYIVGSFFGPIVFSGMAPGPLKDALKFTDQIYIAEDLRNCRPAFYQATGHHRPYATYIHLDEAATCAAAAGASPGPQQFDYAYPADQATAMVSGTPVTTILAKFSRAATTQWTWEPTTQKWLRAGKTFTADTLDPHLMQSGVQLSATNVIVLRATVRYKYSDDPETLLLVDGGTGYVATGGQYVEIRWTKSERTDAFHLTTLEGGPVLLAPGNTWVELLPEAGTGEVQTLSFDDVVITTGK